MELVKYKDKATQKMQVGVGLQSLLDNIVIAEISYPGQADQVVARLKYTIMVQLGKIEVPEQTKQEGEEHGTVPGRTAADEINDEEAEDEQ